MISILEEAEQDQKKRGGKPNSLTIPNRLLMTLEYLREYRTYFHISASYGISESGCYRNIKWVENTLIKHPDLGLPGKKALLKSDMGYEFVLIDATASPIERPKKKIICTAFSNGKCHDFRLFKESRTHLHSTTKLIVDTGYQGISKLHARSELPKKKSKKQPLTKADKKNNRSLSSQRVLSENNEKNRLYTVVLRAILLGVTHLSYAAPSYKRPNGLLGAYKIHDA
eukprot:gene163-217_t